MTSCAATPARNVYVGREGTVSFEADHNSERVTITVAGKSAEVSVPEAQRMVERMKRAIVWAQE